MIEGFTPTFFLELVIAIGSGLGSFFAMRENMKTLFRQQAEETRLREKLSEETDKSIHDVRGDVEKVSGRVYVIEGRMAERP